MAARSTGPDGCRDNHGKDYRNNDRYTDQKATIHADTIGTRRDQEGEAWSPAAVGLPDPAWLEQAATLSMSGAVIRSQRTLSGVSNIDSQDSSLYASAVCGLLRLPRRRHPE